MHLEVGAHFVGQATQADASEEVDGEAHVAGRVLGEDAAKPGCALWVLQPLVQGLQPHVLGQVLCTLSRPISATQVWTHHEISGHYVLPQIACSKTSKTMSAGQLWLPYASAWNRAAIRKPVFRQPNATAWECSRAHLEEDFYEDAGAGGGVVLGDADAVQHRPRNGVRGQQVRKKLGHVAQLVGFQPVHKGVLLAEAVLVQRLPALPVPTVPLRQEPVVPAMQNGQSCALLHRN